MKIASLCEMAFFITYTMGDAAAKKNIESLQGQRLFNAAKISFFENQSLRELLVRIMSKAFSSQLTYESSLKKITHWDLYKIPSSDTERMMLFLAKAFFFNCEVQNIEDPDLQLILRNVSLPILQRMEDKMKEDDALIYTDALMDDHEWYYAERNSAFHQKLYPLFVRERERRSQIAISF